MTTTDSRHDADAAPRDAERDAPLDALFDALAPRRCRDLLRYLGEREDGAVVLEDLVARLADDGEPDHRVRARLHHTYLPRLADAGLVDYDPECGLVQRTADGRVESVRSVLAAFETADLPVSVDTLLELLSALRRRRAFLTLLDHGDLSLPDLADEVAVAETGRQLPEIDPDDVLQVYLSLYHTHVQKLAEAGLVEYDQERDFVALTDAGRALEAPVRDLCDAAPN